jgi:hypothetical protein
MAPGKGVRRDAERGRRASRPRYFVNSPVRLGGGASHLRRAFDFTENPEEAKQKFS